MGFIKKNKKKFITLIGNSSRNSPKKKKKNEIYFSINSKAYNHIGLQFLFIPLSVVNLIIGKNVCKA